MADSVLRTLERRWRSTGCLDDWIAYDRELERAGQLAEPEPERVIQSKRDRRLAAEVSLFVGQYARKRPRGGGEPNDRRYDRRTQRRVKKMDPWDLDELLNGPREL